MIIETEFDIGQEVYLRTDPDQEKGVIVELKVFPGGLVVYTISFGSESSPHYDFELSEEKMAVYL